MLLGMLKNGLLKFIVMGVYHVVGDYHKLANYNYGYGRTASSRVNYSFGVWVRKEIGFRTSLYIK